MKEENVIGRCFTRHIIHFFDMLQLECISTTGHTCAEDKISVFCIPSCLQAAEGTCGLWFNNYGCTYETGLSRRIFSVKNYITLEAA